MQASDIIRLKRDGRALGDAQIAWLIAEAAAGRVPDYQLSAWLMAAFLNGLSAREMAALTDAMMRSGEIYDLSGVDGVKADKHSTGGVGDKVSLILAPLAAACGLVVPMISGRGLGHTGGTLDKLESIPGFTTQLTRARFIRQLKKIGVALGGQTKRFVPADRKLYALRDVTATVESIPLISASIMSKKMAEGCEALVLDVKTGSGAFMAKPADAERLAKTMTQIGRRMGRKVSAMITDMSQPLGRAIGNANEVAESIAALRGEGPEDLMTVTRGLTGRMLTLGGLAKNAREAEKKMSSAIESGAALEKLRDIIEAQGGDARVIDRPRLLPRAPKVTTWKAPRSGYLAKLDTRKIGLAAVALGAGRATMTDPIDPGVGMTYLVRLGDRVRAGRPIFEIAYRERTKLREARRLLDEAVGIGERPRRPPRLIRRARI